MHLRPMTLADIPHCVTLHDAAFADNELSNVLAPHRFRYPLSWRRYAINVFRKKYFNPKSIGLVCVANDQDNFADSDKILGFARWEKRLSKDDRFYPEANPRMRTLSVAESVDSWLCWAELEWHQALRTNPTIDWKAQDAFLRTAVTSTTFADIRASTHWYLDNLAVAPQYQRRGVGAMLLRWGLDAVAEETAQRVAAGLTPVPIALIATWQALPIYRSAGFKVIGWADDGFMPTRARGGANMLYDPTGYWIRDIGDVQQWPRSKNPERGQVEAAFTSILDRSKAVPKVIPTISA